MSQFPVWIVVIAFIVAFFDAYSIGANDVANSFATSVGSRTLSLKKAAILACFTEAIGAILLGKEVADTIKSKIINPSYFDKHPEILMLGMMCAMIGSSTWVLTATRFGLPVSTTHAIIGAILGIGIACGGTSSINWGWTGFGGIVASWFLSPILAGIVAALLYLSVKYLVLIHSNAYERAKRFVSIYFFATFGIIAFFVVYKGAPNLRLDKLPTGAVIGTTLGISILMTIFAHFVVVPRLAQYIDNTPDPGSEPEKNDGPTAVLLDYGSTKPLDSGKPETPIEEPQKEKKWHKYLTQGLEQDVVTVGDDLKGMHDAAEKFDLKAERLFSFMQIMTACFQSFAHGANDLANALGPLAAVWYIYNNKRFKADSDINLWQVFFTVAALDIGLVTYGYKIMKSLGNHMTYMSPARGFNMELGAMLTVLTASKLGLPISTTHCITGSTAGVALCNGDVRSLNWKLLAQCFLGWMATLPIAGLTAALIFSAIVYGPKMPDVWNA